MVMEILSHRYVHSELDYLGVCFGFLSYVGCVSLSLDHPWTLMSSIAAILNFKVGFSLA